MPDIDRRYVIIGLVYAIAGMATGIWMGMIADYTLRPLHAHILLIGAVFFILFGLLYRAYPDTKADSLTRYQFWTANLGTPLFLVGVWLAISGIRRDVAHVGAGVILLSLILMLVILLRAGNSKATQQ